MKRALRTTLSFFGAEDGVERPAPGKAPTAFRIWKAGLNKTDKGDVVFSEHSAELLMAEQAMRGNLYAIDVDHLSLSEKAPPESRKAAGWNRLAVRLSNEGPELWTTDCEWVDFARVGLEKDPPEWRYFSPAFDVSTSTNEVISYLNTALTNNPATWSVTALASRGAEKGVKMTRKEMVAALEHMANGEGVDGKSVATAILAMIKSGEIPKDEEAPHKEPDGNESKEAPKEASEGAPEGEPVGDEEEKKDTSRVAASVTADVRVIRLLESIESERKAERTAREKEKLETERKLLVASRVVTNVEVKKWLLDSATPIQSVRDACRVLPLASTDTSPAAAATVQATRGESQGTGAGALEQKQADALDSRMGIRSTRKALRHEDGRRLQILGAIDAKERTEIMARRASRKAGE